MKTIIKKYIKVISLLVIIAASLSSCSLYKNPAATEELSSEALPTDFLIPENWGGKSGDSTSVSDDWYLSFDETKLNELIEEALDTNNPGIVYRMARIEQSIAAMALARSGRQVHMGYGASYAGNTDFSSNSSSIGSLALPISWEADLWGRLKAGMLAANESMLAEVHQYDFTRQAIAANVSRLYFQIGTIQQSLVIGREFKQINERLIEIQETREDIGITDSKDVHLAKANVASIESVINTYENELQESIRSLEVILGNYPENKLEINWEAKPLEEVTEIQDPYTLISRRPDLLSLENQVRSSFYLSQQAELAKYPSLVLTASPSLGTAGGFAMGIGASLLGPIINGKAIQSKIEIANAQQKQLLAIYGSAILDAFNEVESNLKAEQLLNERLAYAQELSQESKFAYEIAVEQYKVGQQDLYYTLLLQSQYLLADLNVVDIKAQLYFRRVQLFLSLGGNIN